MEYHAKTEADHHWAVVFRRAMFVFLVFLVFLVAVSLTRPILSEYSPNGRIIFFDVLRTGTLRLSSNYNMKELMRSRQIRLQDHQKAEAKQQKNKRGSMGSKDSVPGGNTAKAVAIGVGVLKIFNPPAIVKQCAEAVAERVKRVVRRWC